MGWTLHLNEVGITQGDIGVQRQTPQMQMRKLGKNRGTITYFPLLAAIIFLSVDVSVLAFSSSSRMGLGQKNSPGKPRKQRQSSANWFPALCDSQAAFNHPSHPGLSHKLPWAFGQRKHRTDSRINVPNFARSGLHTHPIQWGYYGKVMADLANGYSQGHHLLTNVWTCLWACSCSLGTTIVRWDMNTDIDIII